MGLKKCKECGAMISSSARVCPQCGRRKPSGCGLFVLLIFVIIVVFIGIMSEESNNSTIKKNSVAENHKQEEIVSVDYSKEVGIITKSGLLTRFNPHLNEAYVNRYMWDNIDVQDKEKIALILGHHSGNVKGTNLYWVHIKDSKSGKVIAKYSKSWGFKVYD